MSSTEDAITIGPHECTDFFRSLWPDPPALTQTRDQLGISTGALPEIAGAHLGLSEKRLDVFKEIF